MSQIRLILSCGHFRIVATDEANRASLGSEVSCYFCAPRAGRAAQAKVHDKELCDATR